MKLAIELANTAGYGVIHKAGCRDLRDSEALGDATSCAEANALAADLTGWDEDSYSFAPCTKGIK